MRAIDRQYQFRLDVDRLYDRLTLVGSVIRCVLLLAVWLERRSERWSFGERRDFWRGTF